MKIFPKLNYVLCQEKHISPASNPKLFNEIVNRFLSEPFKDQILTLQNGRNNCS
jgi:hypothetical protein